MKKLIIRNIYNTLMLLLLTVCCNAQVGNLSESTKLPFENKIQKEDIIKWLKGGIQKDYPIKSKMIQNILNNGLFDKISFENYGNTEIFIVLPLKKTNLSQHIRKDKPLPFQYLMMIETPKGEIRKAEVVLFYPDDEKLIEMPENFFYNTYTFQTFPVDGTFTRIFLNDVKFSEKDTKNHQEVQVRMWQKNKSNNNIDGSGEWTLVTLEYLKEGSIPFKETKKSLGINSNECPPGFKCDGMK